MVHNILNNLTYTDQATGDQATAGQTTGDQTTEGGQAATGEQATTEGQTATGEQATTEGQTTEQAQPDIQTYQGRSGVSLTFSRPGPSGKHCVSAS